jgi:hypothetical protein
MVNQHWQKPAHVHIQKNLSKLIQHIQIQNIKKIWSKLLIVQNIKKIWSNFDQNLITTDDCSEYSENLIKTLIVQNIKKI